MDADELQTLQDRAVYFGLDKTEDFEDFKKKYLAINGNVTYNGTNSTAAKFIRTSRTRKTAKTKKTSTETPKPVIDSSKVFQQAKDGERHGGVYRDALKKTKSRLLKSIRSHNKEVALHQDKLLHPEKYDAGWNSKTQNEKDGLLKKWRKDMQRNAEQAEVERQTYLERFGEEP